MRLPNIVINSDDKNYSPFVAPLFIAGYGTFSTETHTMKSADTDLVNRRPVWEALSDLFLDTDVSLSRAWRASLLAASPYSIDDLERILIDEVYPICKYSLLSVAGEWAGFDQVWLEGRILRRLSSPMRALHAINLGRLIVPLLAEWRATKEGVAAARNEQESTVA